MFDESCEDYDNLVTLLQQPGFRHLDLALVADRQDYIEQSCWTVYRPEEQPWSSFQSGLLKQALEKMENPDHVSIRVHLDERWCHRYLQAHGMYWLPLRSIIPVGKWQEIRHLGISGILVDVDELISVLASQPRTLRSVELSCLIFTEDTNHSRSTRTGYAHLLEKMRSTLQWGEREEEERPVVMIHVNSQCDNDIVGCVDYYVNDYLYAEGPNIFYNRALQECWSRSVHLRELIIGRRGSPKPSCYLRGHPTK